MTQHLGLPIPSPALLRARSGTRFRRRGGLVRGGQRHPVGPVRQGRPQGRGDGGRTWSTAGGHRPVPGGGDRGGAGVPAGVDRLPARDQTRRRRSSPSPRRTAGSPATTSTCGTRASARRSSRSAPTSRIRPRSGSTGTSGPSGRPPGPGSASPSCPTGSPPATTRPRCRRICDRLQPGTIEVFAQRWLHRLPLPFGPRRPAGRVLVGDCRCARSRSPAPSCSTRPATPGRSSRPWSPTTSTSAAPTTSRSSSTARSAATPRACSAPPSTARGRRHRRRRAQRLLQALPDQAVPQRRPRAADRDRHQRPPRPGLQRPPAQPRRTPGQGPCRQPPLLDAERAGQGTVLASPAFERIAHPSVDADGRRTPALRFGDPRVMALAGALCATLLRRHRHHQQEPARLDDRTARHAPYTPRPDDLRPAPAPPATG